MATHEIITYFVLAIGANYSVPADMLSERGDYVEIVKASEEGVLIAEHRYRDLRIDPPNEEE